jgi:hypothetical protein
MQYAASTASGLSAADRSVDALSSATLPPQAGAAKTNNNKPKRESRIIGFVPFSSVGQMAGQQQEQA